jgi:hypothetical protein
MISFRSCCFRMVGDRGHARRIIEPRVASHSECFQFQVFEGSIRPSRSLLWYTQAGILCIDTPYRNQNNPALHTDKIDGREDSHDSANRYTIDADSSKVNACSPSHRQSNAVMMHPTFPLASGPGRLGAVNARRAMPALTIAMRANELHAPPQTPHFMTGLPRQNGTPYSRRMHNDLNHLDDHWLSGAARCAMDTVMRQVLA